jgi:hypothetical protein
LSHHTLSPRLVRPARWLSASVGVLIGAGAWTVGLLALLAAVFSRGAIALGIGVGFVLLGWAVLLGARLVRPPSARTSERGERPGVWSTVLAHTPADISPGLAAVATIGSLPVGLIMLYVGAVVGSTPLAVIGLCVIGLGPLLFALGFVFSRR